MRRTLMTITRFNFTGSSAGLMLLLLAVMVAAPADALTIQVPRDHSTIQAAIDSAVDGDEIVLADGVYAGPGNTNLDFHGKAITVRSANGPDSCIINCSLTARGFLFHSGEGRGSAVVGLSITRGSALCDDGGGILILDSGPTISGCAFKQNRAQSCCTTECSALECCRGRGGAVASLNGTPRISDCVFLNNSSTGTTYFGIGGGGAMYVRSSPALIEHCVFSGNTCQGRGGAVVIEQTAGTVVDCLFTINQAQNGGGLHLYYASPLVRNCRFTANTASFSGGMYTANGSPVIEDCTFESNSAGSAGGLENIGTTTVRDCDFLNNIAFSQEGGGISSYDSISLLRCQFRGNTAHTDGGAVATITGYPLITDCRFENNHADQQGGGIYNGMNSLFPPPCSPRIERCTFVGNSANSGGAISNYYHTAPVIVNSLIAGNSAAYNAGAVFSQWDSHSVYVNTTIVGNHSGIRAGAILIHPSSVVQLRNCIMWGNTAATEGNQVWMSQGGAPPVLDVVHTTFQGGLSDIFHGPEASILWGPAVSELDPRFVDAARGDYRLSASSPFIDAGDNGAVPAGVALDLAGQPRFADDPHTTDTGVGAPPIVDFGAYEFQPASTSGDLNGDGAIDSLDLGILLSSWSIPRTAPGCGGTAPCPADLNGDGFVNTLDLGILLSLWTL